MPLLQSVVGELDQELARLQQLRRIVADLGHTPAVVRSLVAPSSPSAVSALAVSAPAAIEPRRQPRKRAAKPREPKMPRAVSPSRALVAVVPSGPVVVSPARLAQEREQRARTAPDSSEPTVQQPEDLDALSRSLAARWTTGILQ